MMKRWIERLEAGFAKKGLGRGSLIPDVRS